MQTENQQNDYDCGRKENNTDDPRDWTQGGSTRWASMAPMLVAMPMKARIGTYLSCLIRQITLDDYAVGYPFREAGWEMGEEINPQIYSKEEWSQYSFTPFYKNVEHDKQVLL